MLKSLGLIEVIGFVGAVEAADVALKAANVTLIGIEKVSAGIVTVKIAGDVGAVKAAVEASEESARRLGVLRTSHVIARLHEETQRILQDQKSKEDITITETLVSEETKDINITEEACEIIEEKIVEDEVVEETFDDESEKSLEDINSMKVEELRRLARNLKIPTMTNKQIKFAKKDVLIEELVKFYKESDK